jgi:hypothetical protein
MHLATFGSMRRSWAAGRVDSRTLTDSFNAHIREPLPVLHIIFCGVQQTPDETGTPWTQALDKKLKELAEQNTASRSIAHSLDRSTDAIYAHASEKNVTPKQTNQSPYTRQKKG